MTRGRQPSGAPRLGRRQRPETPAERQEIALQAKADGLLMVKIGEDWLIPDRLRDAAASVIVAYAEAELRRRGARQEKTP